MRRNLFSEPVYLLAYSTNSESYQPLVGRKRSLRPPNDSEALTEDVTQPLNRLATELALIGTLVAPRFAKPPELVATLTSSSLYVRNARTSRTRASNSSG